MPRRPKAAPPIASPPIASTPAVPSARPPAHPSAHPSTHPPLVLVAPRPGAHPIFNDLEREAVLRSTARSTDAVFLHSLLADAHERLATMMSARDEAIIERDEAIIERDEAIIERDGAITERADAITKHNTALAAAITDAITERAEVLKAEKRLHDLATIEPIAYAFSICVAAHLVHLDALDATVTPDAAATVRRALALLGDA